MQNSFWQGWNTAFDAVWAAVAAAPDDSLTPEAKRFKTSVLDWLGERFIDEDLLKPKPTNTELAEKYAVSPRTITNWRKAECPFEDGQWRVLDWLAERRIVPVGAKARFNRQLERRQGSGQLDELGLLTLQAKQIEKAARQAGF